MAYRFNRGLGCESTASLATCCDSCAAGGSCGRGLGCSCNRGMSGLFDAGMDVSQWGIGEWSLVGLGAYMVLSTVFTTKRAAGRIAAIPGERRKRKAAKYRKLADDLTRKGGKKKRAGEPG